MDIYTDFVVRLRRKELDDVYILLAEDVMQKLKKYVLLLKNVEFDVHRPHTFYGEVKRIIASFIIYYTTTIDEVIKLADAYTNVVEKHDLLLLLERTMSIHQTNQIEFKSCLLPVQTGLEKEVFEEIENEYYYAYAEKHSELKKKIENLNRQNEVEDFAKEHFPKVVKMTNEMFDMAHVYLAMMLADSITETRASLNEILHRLVKNLKKVQEEHEETINSLLGQLYDKNKECIIITRNEANNSAALAEVSRCMDNIRMKIENFETDVTIARLENEIAYWTNRIEYFEEICESLTQFKAEQDNLIRSENALLCNTIPGCKTECWEIMVANIAQRKDELTQMIINQTKALVTFFALRGSNRITYTDNIGSFYLDEFNHKVYLFDYSLEMYHVGCDGEFKDFPDYEYYYDRHGRYIENDDGEKVYQCAPCTSQYKIDESGLFTKTTKDCGHSEKDNKNCKMEISDPSRVEILPDFEPIDISQTLDTDTVKYLWDSFGSVLPMALNDVGKARPLNPIHFLAHKLLHHKYSRTKTEQRQKIKEATRYKEDVFQKRLEKAVAESKKCKSKQVKPRKPEESDDAEGRAVYNAQVAELMFINSLNFFNY